jgi:hypothetical protein
MRRLVQLLLIGGLIAGAWALLRELLEQPPSEPSTREPSPKRSESSAAESEVRNNGAADVSKAELYRQAQELDVEGRSKMTKDELAAAVAKARRGGGS